METKVKGKDEARALVATPEFQRELAGRSFRYFLDYVNILERPQPLRGIEGGVQPFQKWDHLMELAEMFETKRLITVLKARQVGFSWIVSAYALWMVVFRDGTAVMELSRGQLESRDLLDKAKFIYKHLPAEWNLPEVAMDNASGFRLKGMESEMVALPSTEDAGRGKTSSLVIQDEADFHQYAEANLVAVKPTIDGGGQLIMASTVNKRSLRSPFKNFYGSSPSNGWAKLFVPWSVRPERTQEWYEQVKVESADLPEAQDLGIDLYMEQEYPSSEAEALRPAKAMAAFSRESIERMMGDVKEPLRKVGPINIYREHQWEKRYCAGSDPAHGVGGDFSVTVVMEADTGNVVADIISDQIGPDELAVHSMEMLAMYHNPVWAIEDNEWGAVCLHVASSANYPSFFKRVTGTKAVKVGWHTDKSSRGLLWYDLIDAVQSGAVSVPNRQGLEQFYSVIRDPTRSHRPEAMEGAHDDYPMAVAIALQAASQSFRRRAPRVVEGFNTNVLAFADYHRRF